MSFVQCEGVANPKTVERFLAKVGEPDENGCRNWTGGFAGRKDNPQGYFRGGPKRGRGRVQIVAYRFAYALAFGEPGNQVVRHKCDNPKCVEPAHLELGSFADNTRDMNERFVTEGGGEGGGMAKLTHEQAAEVYRLAHETRLTAKEIGEMFGISHHTVYQIKYARRRRYSIEEAA
ncbi:HNH endonuclease [Streptomyces phage Goby]|uniref:HNH endonuclease n=1 Tax=Streptomyces phage Goby TaxID=2182319 RepID=A0A2U8UTV4_9CAUD|nr:endonuclease [Streptomyces phage Goby]AWN07574.1 HNH endonuclease [Streptomyces phage Goby]